MNAESNQQRTQMSIEPIDVSYAILRKGTNIEETLQKISIAINVQLTFDMQTIPFVAYDGFENIRHSSKLFLFGPSGCGKSRILYEIIKRKITEYDSIIILNPRNTAGIEEVGRTDLFELIQRIDQNDAILWDNFPE